MAHGPGSAIPFWGRDSQREFSSRMGRKGTQGGSHGLLHIPMGDGFDVFAPVPALMAAADATKSIRIGYLVLDNNLRHPIMLARETATIDLLSAGRLEMGIGAGWMRAGYERAGIPFESPGIRVGRMEEAVKVIKGMWANGPFTFVGKHYSVNGLDGYPKPLQKPRPPLCIAGGGRRLLSFAAREADVVGLGPEALPNGTLDIATATAEATARKVGWIQRAAGDRFDLLFHVKVTDNRMQAAEKIIAGGSRLTAQYALESPHELIGIVDQMVEDLQARREEYGIPYIAVGGNSMESLAPVVARLLGK